MYIFDTIALDCLFLSLNSQIRWKSHIFHLFCSTHNSCWSHVIDSIRSDDWPPRQSLFVSVLFIFCLLHSSLPHFIFSNAFIWTGSERKKKFLPNWIEKSFESSQVILFFFNHNWDCLPDSWLWAKIKIHRRVRPFPESEKLQTIQIIFSTIK